MNRKDWLQVAEVVLLFAAVVFAGIQLGRQTTALKLAASAHNLAAFEEFQDSYTEAGWRYNEAVEEFLIQEKRMESEEVVRKKFERSLMDLARITVAGQQFMGNQYVDESIRCVLQNVYIDHVRKLICESVSTSSKDESVDLGVLEEFMAKFDIPCSSEEMESPPVDCKPIGSGAAFSGAGG